MTGGFSPVSYTHLDVYKRQILHNRDRVSGLTSAASVWAVASIGMACGAGLYFPAIFATIVVLVVLELVRVLEYRGNLKLYSSTYEVRGFDVEKLTVAILHVMDRENRHMDALENDPVGELQRLSFSISAKMCIRDRNNLVQAARKVLEMGPKALVVKHGEYGATAFFCERSFPGEASTVTVPFRVPAMPLAEVVDPTGAGDSFAGGFFGYVASQPTLTPAVFRRAMFYGSVMGSFAVERFGTERLQQLEPNEIEERFALFRQLSHLD